MNPTSRQNNGLWGSTVSPTTLRDLLRRGRGRVGCLLDGLDRHPALPATARPAPQPAVRAGLPVPPGLALGAGFVEAVGSRDQSAEDELTSLPLPFAGGAAVRSSAVGEDSSHASFAGQHKTLLNVEPAGLVEAVRAVWRSLSSEGALAYRRRLGIQERPRMGVVIQQLVPAEVAGVLFTRNPINGCAERLIEAGWGLGEVVVDGRVIPDRYRLSLSGAVIEVTSGRKDVALRPRPGGGILEQPVKAEGVEQRCLTERQLEQLHLLAADCEAVFGHGQDVEWALSGPLLHLLQVRPLTTIR
jgi:pyruvate, water dikinase